MLRNHTRGWVKLEQLLLARVDRRIKLDQPIGAHLAVQWRQRQG